MRDTHGRPAPSPAQTAPPLRAADPPTDGGRCTRPRYLVIVSREALDLWAHVAQELGEFQGVQLLLDRRQRKRRQGGQPVARERRRAERRRPPTAEGDLRRHPFLLVIRE